MKNLFKLVILVSLLLGCFSQVNASEQFIFQNTKLKGEDGKMVELYLGVPVEILKDMDKEAKVSIKGFIDGNNIYSTKEKELLIAKMDEGFKLNKKNSNQVELVGMVEKEYLTENGAEVWEEHEEFFYEMCTQCHAAQVVNHHTMIEWEALFTPMKGFAKLDEEESAYLLRYLKSNASDGLIKTSH
jgi:trimethylamine-N-oxide reductase cytochrome c-type subunit TorC